MEAETPKAEPPKRKRRWFQFSLRTLVIVVTLFALPCSYVSRQAIIVRKRLQELDRLTPEHSIYVILDPNDSRGVLPFIRRLLGDKSVADIHVMGSTLAEIKRINEVFPEADVGGSLSLEALFKLNPELRSGLD
jgi:hypothetical protein